MLKKNLMPSAGVTEVKKEIVIDLAYWCRC
jgi:hypothetical protein